MNYNQRFNNQILGCCLNVEQGGREFLRAGYNFEQNLEKEQHYYFNICTLHTLFVCLFMHKFFYAGESKFSRCFGFFIDMFNIYLIFRNNVNYSKNFLNSVNRCIFLPFIDIFDTNGGEV